MRDIYRARYAEDRALKALKCCLSYSLTRLAMRAQSMDDFEILLAILVSNAGKPLYILLNQESKIRHLTLIRDEEMIKNNKFT